jgi:hypothetical protein
MSECPIGKGQPPDKESGRQNQFYTFDLGNEGGIITFFIDSEIKQFRISEYFPKLSDEGKVVLALLAKTGCFSGFFYDKGSHQKQKSHIITFFDKFELNFFPSNIETSEGLLGLLFPELEEFDPSTVLVGKEFMSEIFYFIGINQSDDEKKDVFRNLNNLILRENGSWDKVYMFWAEYIDLKKRLFNFAEGTLKKKYHPKHLFLFEEVARDINIYFLNKINNWLSEFKVGVGPKELETLKTIIDGETRSGMRFLIEHFTNQNAWKTLQTGNWQLGNTLENMALGMPVGLALSLFPRSLRFNSLELLYYGPNPGDCISGCPVRGGNLLNHPGEPLK